MRSLTAGGRTPSPALKFRAGSRARDARIAPLPGADFPARGSAFHLLNRGVAIPYDLEQTLATAHCIDIEDIERAILGDRAAQSFINHYGRSDRQRWRDLTAPFRPDPFEGRCVVAGGHGGDGRDYVKRKLPSDVQLRRQWERYLARFDLDVRTINGSGERQDVIIPANSTPPLKNCREDVQLAARYGVAWQACHAVPLAVHEREVPAWANSDLKVREFLQHRFPGAFREAKNGDPRSEKGQIRKRARKRAAELAAIVYLAYRLLLPFDVIGDELHVDAEHALRVAADARAHGDRYFRGESCCRNRKIPALA